MQPIVLIGFMGCGKSRVGHELARLLSVSFVDLDERIVEAAGMPIPELFASRGEGEFRRLESRELEHVLSKPGVVATGGGVVTIESNRLALRESGAPVVWLQAPAQVLAARIRSEPGARPLIDGGQLLDLEQTTRRVEELLLQRAAFYAQAATLEVETSEKTPEQIARDIAHAVSVDASTST
jgi:shikimate kinase